MNSNISLSLPERVQIAVLEERARRRPESLLCWSEAYRSISGKPMMVPPALHALYEDRHPHVAVRKPTQVGGTEYCLNAALWGADTKLGGRGNVLYLLPTADLAERTSQVRLNRAIQQSPYLTGRAQPERGVASLPANVQRRHIGEGMIVFAGADQESQYTGFDADLVILDEFDLMRDEVFSQAQQRLRSSHSPQLIAVSTPNCQLRASPGCSRCQISATMNCAARFATPGRSRSIRLVSSTSR